MIAMMSLFWGLVIFAGVMIFRATGNGRARNEDALEMGASYRDPIDILDERFARGELDRDEYEARTAVLRGSTR